MKLTNFITFVVAFVCSLGVFAIDEGEYYIYNDFYGKALTNNDSGGPVLGAVTTDDAACIFEAVNKSGDYVMLRQKSTGKYLTASTSDTWSVALSSAGTGDQYYWKLDQLFSTTVVSKKNTSKRLGCDFKSGSTYYWNETYVPIYYDKSAGAMNWFSIIPANGEGFESSRNAARTAQFTNEYGIKEQDDYQVDEAVQVEGIDYHILSSTPFDGGSVNLVGSGSWLVFDNVRPSTVKSSFLKYVTINGEAAVAGTNCRVEIYLRGAAVIPTPEEAPFVAVTDEGTFSVGVGNTTDLGENSNKARSFVLKRGYMATVATGTSGGGYSRVYVADHKDLTVTLPTALDQRISSVYVRNWHYTCKSGYVGSGDKSYATKVCGGSWYWNWDASQTSTADVEYIPIKQHLYWPSDASMNKSGSTAMMLFNEPEHSEQHTSSKCTCGGTISSWTAYQNTPKFNSNGLRIGSPSATDLSYIKEYDNYCYNMAQRCDFNCTHGYWSSEWSSSLSTLKGYGKPIWITEWEWGASWTSGTNPSSADDARDKVLTVLDMLEYNDYVERYSYYEFDTGGTNGWMREMFWENNASKGNAYVGQVYSRVKPHLGYKSSIQPVPNWWAPSVSTPEIQNVYLSNGKYTISVKNGNCDATKQVTIMIKNGSSWETLTTVTDRSLFESSVLGVEADLSAYGPDITLKAVVTTLYSTSSVESAEYTTTIDDVSEDPLSELKNLGFDEGTFTKNEVITYAKDITGTKVSGEQAVEGWTANDAGGDAHASAQIAWGSTNAVGGYTIPTTDKDGASNGGALAVLGCWSSTTQYTQDVTFPAGKYTITVPVYNAAGSTSISKNLIGFIEDSGTEHLAKTTNYAVGWTTETLTFELSGLTAGKLSAGYTAAQAGSGSMPHLYIDGFTISNGTETWPKTPEPVYYTITFVDADSNVLSAQQVLEGDSVTNIPTAPEREGYKFIGWTPNVVPATADATYTATYGILSYTLTYYVDDEEYDKSTLEYGAEITPLDAPSKDGYEFSGWSEIPSTMPAHDVTVTGTFKYIIPDAILSLMQSGNVTAIYSPSGVLLSTPRKGINILKMSDNSIRKVIVK